MCDYNDFFVRRLQQLRDKKNISARKMSLDLGQNKDYINHIENKKNRPTLENFFNICQYFGITPEDFFCFEKDNPAKLQDIFTRIENLNDRQLDTLSKIIYEFELANLSK